MDYWLSELVITRLVPVLELMSGSPIDIPCYFLVAESLEIKTEIENRNLFVHHTFVLNWPTLVQLNKIQSSLAHLQATYMGNDIKRTPVHLLIPATLQDQIFSPDAHIEVLNQTIILKN